MENLLHSVGWHKNYTLYLNVSNKLKFKLAISVQI